MQCLSYQGFDCKLYSHELWYVFSDLTLAERFRQLLKFSGLQEIETCKLDSSSFFRKQVKQTVTIGIGV